MTPLISVVIPVYNGGKTLADAIQSVVDQTYPHWQLLVHDNASDDNSREVVKSFADERVRLIAHRDCVPMWESWNRCLQGIEGDFFQLLCADDELHPDCFSEKIRRFMSPQGEEVVLVTSNRLLVNNSGKALFSIGYSKREGLFSVTEVMQKAYRVMNPIGDPSVYLLRASALVGMRFTERYPFFVDMELWLHVLAQGKMLHIPKVLSRFRIYSGSASTSRFRKNLIDTVVFYRQRVAPFYRRQRLRYYLGYVFFMYRSLAREVMYRLSR